MDAEPQRLHVAFFPLMAAGHMIPILDIAKLFQSHDVKTTIITTPKNAPFFTKPLKNYNNMGPPINIQIIPFPSHEAGLPKGVENCDQCNSDEEAVKFMKAIELVQLPLEKLFEKLKPDCLVSDMFLSFAMDVAAKFNIPTLVFHVDNCFAQCVAQALIKYHPFKSISTKDEEFIIIPDLPHQIKITKNQLPSFMRGEVENEIHHEWMNTYTRAYVAEKRSYGVIVNTYYELEGEYVDYYRNVVGRKAWLIGPVSLCNRENEAKFQRGKDSSINEYECLKWLDSKKPKSIVYVCFGSITEISTSQLHEIALGLEDSSQDFIWVVRRNDKDVEEEWLPHGFEKRMEGKALIIRGWAPQVLILDHQAIGAFVTHCGWNSTLEGISSGVPMVTWPTFAEQFYNEKLVTEILKIGISIGAKEWSKMVDGIKREDISLAIKRVMVSEEASEITSRANKFKELARKAVEVGGSSYSDLCSLIQELSSINTRVSV